MTTVPEGLEKAGLMLAAFGAGRGGCIEMADTSLERSKTSRTDPPVLDGRLDNSASGWAEAPCGSHPLERGSGPLVCARLRAESYP
jgi:hypothetical protein